MAGRLGWKGMIPGALNGRQTCIKSGVLPCILDYQVGYNILGVYILFYV